MSCLKSKGARCLVAVVQMGLLAAAGPAFAATGKVHVADEESGTVSVIDAASFNKIGSITNTCADTVSVVDIALRKVIGTVPVGRGPNGISVTP